MDKTYERINSLFEHGLIDSGISILISVVTSLRFLELGLLEQPAGAVVNVGQIRVLRHLS